MAKTKWSSASQAQVPSDAAELQESQCFRQQRQRHVPERVLQPVHRLRNGRAGKSGVISTFSVDTNEETFSP